MSTISNIDPRLTSPPNKSRRNEKVGSQRAKQLERNRVAATKCRMKRKREHEQIQRVLNDESTKHDNLVSIVDCLKEEIWCLKNQVFNHVPCNDPQINFELAKIGERVAQNNPAAMRYPSPTFSASSFVSEQSSGDSGGSAIEAAPPIQAAPSEKIDYEEYPDDMFERFIETD
ncbi:hypothetical protein N7456_004778 [Penicillium angulare]|uniref:BZIP domain-containing protein n=1 Tax=Penicillium angulare TaxID=116970 RepID=A0A9W9KJW4_9EURO|nr:hypothetical protein N7456_004778 [Penicillium angulare]